MNQQVDIAIVGGGIMGTSIAWALARRGIRNVALFERSTIAAGASGRTGALLRRHYSNEPEARLAQMGYTIFRDWELVVGGDCGHVPHGLVVTVDCSPEHVTNIDKLWANVEMQKRLGIESQVISGRDLHALQPFLNTGDIPFAAYEPETGYVDAVAATQSMALAARDLGVQIHEQTAVLGIASSGGRVSGLDTSGGRVSGDVVVIANGPWATKTLATAQVEVPITTLRVQIAIVQRPLSLAEPHFVLIDTAAGMFTRPWGPGRSLVGVGGGDQHDEVDPDDFEPRNDPGYPATAIDAIAHRIPGMRGAVYLHGHAGLYDMTPDAHPIIGSTPVEGVYMAAGFCGAGFKKGPAVGICLAEAIDGAQPAIDLSPFALSRFDSHGWERPWSETEYTFSRDFGHKF